MKKKSRVNRSNIAEFMYKHPWYIVPRVFFEAKYKRLSDNAKMAYAVLVGRISTGEEEGWINDGDEIDEIYIKCDIDRGDHMKNDLVEKLRSATPRDIERVRADLKNGRISDVKAYIESIFPQARLKSFRDDIKCELDRELRRVANDLAEELGMSKLVVLRAIEELVEFNLVSGARELPDGTAKKISFDS